MLKNHTKRERRIRVCWFHSISALTFHISARIVFDPGRTHLPIVTCARAHTRRRRCDCAPGRPRPQRVRAAAAHGSVRLPGGAVSGGERRGVCFVWSLYFHSLLCVPFFEISTYTQWMNQRDSAHFSGSSLRANKCRFGTLRQLNLCLQFLPVLPTAAIPIS